MWGYMSRWDKGVDYETMYELILKRMSRNFKMGRTSCCYDAILLLQLRNGLRVSEAVRGFKEYLLTGATEISVPVSKKKRLEKRLVIVPSEITMLPIKKTCVYLLEEADENIVNRVKVYCIRTYRINTHSLRYSYITYLLKQGVNPAIVSKITKHSRLDYILTYTQQKIGEEILRRMG